MNLKIISFLLRVRTQPFDESACIWNMDWNEFIRPTSPHGYHAFLCLMENVNAYIRKTFTFVKEQIVKPKNQSSFFSHRKKTIIKTNSRCQYLNIIRKLFIGKTRQTMEILISPISECWYRISNMNELHSHFYLFADSFMRSKLFVMNHWLTLTLWTCQNPQ